MILARLASSFSAHRAMLLTVVLAMLPFPVMLIDDGESDRALHRELEIGSPVALSPGAKAISDGSALSLVLPADDAWPWVEYPLPADGSDVRKKLKISFEETRNLSALILTYPHRASRGPERYARLVDLSRGHVYFGLSPTDSDRIRLTFLKAFDGEPIRIRLTGLTVMSRSAIDSKGFFLALAIGTAALMVLAGMVLGTLLQRRRPGEIDSLAGVVLPLSVVAYFLLIYLAMVAGRQLAGLPASFVAPSAAVVLLLGALSWHVRRDRGAGLVRAFSDRAGVLTGYIAIVAVATLVLMKSISMPLQELTWSHIAHYKTFGGHTAHDLGFQYLNGLAIAQDRPFSHYYDAPHLVRELYYDVQDRQVLGGVLYAAYRSVLLAVSTYAGDSYAAYALFGLALTAMAVFPVIVFCRRYTMFRSVPAILFVFSANAFVLVNYYYTWFKLLGGGFVIAGILLLATDTGSVRRWAGAGLAWGVAASFHAGAALTLPFLSLYFAARLLRDSWPSLHRLLLPFVALCLSFSAVMLPWSMIKARNFPDTHDLLRQHFLDREPLASDMWQTVDNFFQRVPPDVQLEKRFSQVAGALRLEKVRRIGEEAVEDGLAEFLHAWSLFEFQFIAILCYPLLFLLILSRLLRPVAGPIRAPPASEGPAREGRALLAVTLCSILVTMFVMYTDDNVDSSAQVPSASIAIVYLLTADAVQRSSRIGRYLLYGYLAFNVFRLAVAYGVG